MKKIILFFIIYFFTNFSYASVILERNDLNIIINGEKVNSPNLPITCNNFTLVPLKNTLSHFNLQNSLNYYNKTLSFSRFSSTLTLKIGDNTGFIDNTPFYFDISPIIYKNLTYVPLKVISTFLDCYTFYDANSKSIFIKDLNEYQQIISFFEKLNNNLNSVNSLKIDVINELYSDNSSFSFGNSLYIDKTSKIVLTKNVLEENWKETNIKINFNNNFFTPDFFVGLSFDRINSDENKMIFYGYYPVNNTLCKVKIYVDPTTFQITRQQNEFMMDHIIIKQHIFYSYNV